MSDNEDPYAISSDSEDETKKGPPPKINIGERTNTDFDQIKSNLTTEKKDEVKDEARREELEELKKTKGDELKKVMESFKEGKVTNESETTKTVEIEKPTGLDRDVLSQFKNKFEKMDETLAANVKEKLEGVEKHLEGLENATKGALKNLKGNFDGTTKEAAAIQREKVEGKSGDELSKIMGTFANPKIDDEGPKDCAICGKIVYSAEKVQANKNIYHYGCFKCTSCGKKLTPVSYHSHEGKLYCKQHMDLMLHPDRAVLLEAIQTDEGADNEEDDEFAVSSKPKQLSSNIIKAGTNIGEELSQIKSLREKKETLQTSIQEGQLIEKKTVVEEDIKSGLVKGNVSRYIAGPEPKEETGPKPTIDLDTDQVSNVKNRWKTGDVQKAEERDQESRTELEEFRKGGGKLKERFHEKTGTEEGDAPVVKSYDVNELDSSNAASARKSFLEGAAFESGPVEKTDKDMGELEFKKLTSFKDKFEKGEDNEPIEKTAVELDIQLGAIKAAFEKGDDMTPEERAELKKKEIDAEFLRIRLARKLQAQKAKEDAGDDGSDEKKDDKKIDIDVKIAGKAREKFKQIEADNPDQHLPMPGQKADYKPSKWDKKEVSTAEIVNKRSPQPEETDLPEDQEEYDVKNIMNRFKNIGKEDQPAKVSKKNDELESLKLKASKNLREAFETAPGDHEDSEEKKKALEEEFKALRDEREKAKQQLQAEAEANAELHPSYKQDEVEIAAEHSHKMTAKWEKIHAKEAKKAQKGQMPTKPSA